MSKTQTVLTLLFDASKLFKEVDMIGLAVFVCIMATALEADILKGDFYESEQDWVYSGKREVFCGWSGSTEDDWGFHLDGYRFDTCRFQMISFGGGHCFILLFCSLDLPSFPPSRTVASTAKKHPWQ